jgi:membrane associated rhomboid family serine protease
MGLQDRDYYSNEQPPQGLTFGGGQRMLVTNLVILNVALFFVDALTTNGSWLSDFLSLKADVYAHPWNFWQLLTYGFVHAPLGSKEGIWHVGLNMFMLWMFGRDIEARLGRGEFLAFYLVSIVVSGLVWLVMENAWLASSGLQGVLPRPPQMLGASGGVTAVFMLFVLFYPRRTLYLWGILAIPAWLIGAFVVGQDLIRGLTGSAGSVAWQAHLAGASFAFLYLKSGWRLSSLVGGHHGWSVPMPRRRPSLKIHDPDRSSQDMEREADRVLAKLHREGEESLTAKERRVLERYSRQMRQKHR